MSERMVAVALIELLERVAAGEKYTPDELADVSAEIARQMAAPDQPTPERLRAMAAWFDDPNRSKRFSVKVAWVKDPTPGYLLRLIADAMAEA